MHILVKNKLLKKPEKFKSKIFIFEKIFCFLKNKNLWFYKPKNLFLQKITLKMQKVNQHKKELENIIKIYKIIFHNINQKEA
ncbi:unknown; predicted coding region [Mycoplasmopsis pulmonis]|uniref:Uncharacterized protein n=1 Tax=Mycoplasmopsis pulmonis (strain UAB CTIP) TaxID=272635 RepID=Q98PH3_MYCPU|nr:unknown; predicted coding region [Mycoplasmopsis pulmonis]